MSRFVLAGLLSLALGSGAFARDNHYGVVAFTNSTNLTVNYAFKWGNGEWRWYTLEPGESRWHSWEYDYANENRSPTPYVRFDEDLSDAIQYRDYRLEAYAAPYQGTDYAKEYAFVKTHGGAYLDLVGK